MAENYNSIKAKTLASRGNGHVDSYWHQIHLFYEQIQGLEFGWRYGLKRSNMKRSGLEIPLVDFFILNLGVDLKLLENHYNTAVKEDSEPKVEFTMRHRQKIRLDIRQDPEQRINLSLSHVLLHA